MFKKIKDTWAEIQIARKYGNELANKEVWKNRQEWSNAATGFALTVLAIFRYWEINLPVTDDQVTAVIILSGYLMTFVNYILTQATSKHAGYH
jgi:hypothetical protein